MDRMEPSPNHHRGAILLTGCAGFIGARTAQLLLAGGWRVVGLDNLNAYYDVRLKQHRLEQLRLSPSFTFIVADIENQQAVESAMDQQPIHAVMNLAARAGVRYSLEHPHVYLTTNALGNLNLLEAMRRRGIQKYVLASTSALYAGQPMPFREDAPVNTPISPYAASKKAAEAMAYTYHYLYGIDVTILRYFTVYGPAARPDMSIFRFVRWIDAGAPVRIHGDGSHRRDFTFVDDIAQGTVAALRPLGFEIINLGGGQRPHSLLEIIDRLERLLGRSAQLQFGNADSADLLETWADIDKASRLLQWRPQVSLDDGLAAAVSWYRDQLPWSAAIEL